MPSSRRHRHGHRTAIRKTMPRRERLMKEWREQRARDDGDAEAERLRWATRDKKRKGHGDGPQ